MSFFCQELERERDSLTVQVRYLQGRLEHAENIIKELEELLANSKTSNKLLSTALDEQ